MSKPDPVDQVFIDTTELFPYSIMDVLLTFAEELVFSGSGPRNCWSNGKKSAVGPQPVWHHGPPHWYAVGSCFRPSAHPEVGWTRGNE